jgi:DNA-binding beta-propeller fold protein YncE
VTKLLASTGAVLGTFYPLGENPSGIAFDGVNIWVANENSNSVTKFLASTGAVLGKFNTGDSPIGVAFDGADIWVTNWLDGTVSKL